MQTRHVSFVRDKIAHHGGSNDKKEGIRTLGKILLQLEIAAKNRSSRTTLETNQQIVNAMTSLTFRSAAPQMTTNFTDMCGVTRQCDGVKV